MRHFLFYLSCLGFLTQEVLCQDNANNREQNTTTQTQCMTQLSYDFDVSKVLVGPCNANDSILKHGFYQESSLSNYEVTLHLKCGCGLREISNTGEIPPELLPKNLWKLNRSGKNKHWAFVRIAAKKKYGITELISPEIRIKQENDTLKYIYYYYAPTGIDSMVFKEKPIY